MTAFIGVPGPAELIFILLLVLMLFGAGKLPQVMAQLGRGVRSLRDAAHSDED